LALPENRFMNIILASASPRRKALLNVLGIEFDVVVSETDEIITKDIPCEIVMDLSLQKAKDVSKKVNKDCIIIGADTVVVYGDKILGKPKNYDDAINMLKMLSGHSHRVYTGFTIIRNSDNMIITDYEKTDVTFFELTDKQITDYVNTNDPMDKAGAYSIQGIASSFVKELCGDYNNVVGLPIYKLSKYLYNDFKIGI